MTARPRSTSGEPFFAATLADPRADRGRREIAINGDHVLISRRLHGIDMRVSLAVAAYLGVALCLRPTQGETLAYQIRLVHPDDDMSVVLDEALDDRNIIADWRLWARVLCLPALVERTLGSYETTDATLDPACPGDGFDRRARPSKTRPKFLAKRKLGDLSALGFVHEDEREIIARS